MPHRRTKRKRTVSTHKQSSTDHPSKQNQPQHQLASSSHQSTPAQPQKRTRISENNTHLIRSQPIPDQNDSEHAANSRVHDSETEDKSHQAVIDDKVFLNETIERLVSQVSLAQVRPQFTAATVSDHLDQHQTTKPDKKPSSDNQQQHERPTRKIRKLGELIPNPIIKSSRASRFTTMGHRQLGLPSSRLAPNYKIPSPLVLTISRRVNFSVYLKQSLDYFKKFKTGQIKLMAMGAAIPMCLSLAMSIESHLPLGNSQTARVRRSVSTGTVIVGDEITPQPGRSQSDLIYQTRKQGSIEIQLSIEFSNQFKSIQQQLFS